MIPAILGTAGRMAMGGMTAASALPSMDKVKKAAAAAGTLLTGGAVASQLMGDEPEMAEETAPGAENAEAAQQTPPFEVMKLPNGSLRIAVDNDNPNADGVKNALSQFGGGMAVQSDKNGKEYTVFTLTDREFERFKAGGL